MRIELIISSLQDWCLTITALEAYLRLPEIESGSTAWQAVILPLNHNRITSRGVCNKKINSPKNTTSF